MVYGIDLGTTNSCIAYIDQYGEPEILKNSEGHDTTPSVVYYSPEGTAIVGGSAHNNLKHDPQNTVVHIKREMGTAYHKPTKFPTGATPVEISALILKKLVADANEATDQNCKDVIITVPAAFGAEARAATKDAGKMAGLNVLRIVNDPTAAAIAYGTARSNATEGPQYIFVYDLGGGTFDVTLLKVENSRFNVLITKGDQHIGGLDWDRRLAEKMLFEYNKQVGTSLSLDTDEILKYTFLEAAEELKKQLTSRNRCTYAYRWDQKAIAPIFTRADFETLTKDLLQKTLNIVEETIQEALGKGVDLQSGNVNFLLVGGSSRMPQVKENVQTLLGKYNITAEPKLYEPDLCVAKGAAQITEAIKESAPNSPVEKPGKSFTDVSSKTYGIMVHSDQGDEVLNFIFAQTRLPHKVKHSFKTSFDGQTIVLLNIYESTSPEQYIPLSAAKLLDKSNKIMLPCPMPKGAKITIEFLLDEQNILHLSTEFFHNEKSIKNKFEVKISGESSEEEIKNGQAYVTNYLPGA